MSRPKLGFPDHLDFGDSTQASLELHVPAHLADLQGMEMSVEIARCGIS